VRTPLIRIAGACALTAALTLSATACSSANKAAACVKLQKTIAEISQKGMTQVSDPAGLAQTYADGANTMRQQGKDSGADDVEKAADHVASAFDSLGQQMKALTTSTSATPQMPDTSQIISAGTELKSACDG
jgi:hypothetical protein